jgi:monothiol glutaredoxin
MTDTLSLTDAELLDQITSEVAEHRVFLYMKGTPDEPRCGFSNQVVQILKLTGAEFGARDVLPDPRIREVLSSWSEWPTIPQLFVDGELYQSGELKELVAAG